MGLINFFSKSYPKIECISIEVLLNGKRSKIPISAAFEIADTSVSDKQKSLF